MCGRTISMVLLLAGLAVACEPASVVGAWCQYPADCRLPSQCSTHRCRPPCTGPGDCATHLCLAGHCAVEQDQGCATIPGRECPSPLVCAEDRCTLLCTTTCASGALCRPASDAAFSICVDPGASPPPDGGLANPG